MIVINMNIFKLTTRKKQVIAWLFVVLWLILIFSFSAQPARQSSNLSQGFTKSIVEFISNLLPLDIETGTSADFAALADHLVRKFAHGLVYFILGLLTVNAFRLSGAKGRRIIIYSLLFCVSYAASDEFHQLFVSGRGAQVTDVCIDSTGAFFGIIISFLIVRLKKLKSIQAR